MRGKHSVIVMAMFCLMFTFGCTHSLKIKNLQDFYVTASMQKKRGNLKLAVAPCKGTGEGTHYFDVVIAKLSSHRNVDEIEINWTKKSDFKPDYIIDINPNVNYESSGWNFLVNFPGFLIFTPAWNGYVYHANIKTEIIVYDGEGNEQKKQVIDTPYSIRQADADRGVIAELSWLEVGALAFIGGIYNAFVYDTDITYEFRETVKENYSSYIVEQIMKATREL